MLSIRGIAEAIFAANSAPMAVFRIESLGTGITWPANQNRRVPYEPLETKQITLSKKIGSCIKKCQ
ncbi:hypothetical protein SBA5_30022 [Candidatus Sulfotelmatomonas gaucii]|uniref:Uncharacterized protein n=1 Tax=Candidatus Sulfuritelmatomonas gaucii TaxID=2043161 RepID=A0A2N9LC02_9BACT|nr:hypothetical protein SBA5_30022 [Candidatus Sulfotelmatomonas gaucii]